MKKRQFITLEQTKHGVTAIADDGTGWLWNGLGWMQLPDLPDRQENESDTEYLHVTYRDRLPF